MPDVTPVYGWPVPVLQDDPNIPADVTALANGIEGTLTGGAFAQVAVMPTGDSSPSQVLTGADVRCGQTSRTTILTTTFSLSHAQYIWVGAKARFEADSTSSAQGDVGMKILVDGTAPALGEAGPGHVNSFANTGRTSFAIPLIPVSLSAGSHTVDLVADRDGTGVVNATGNSALINGHTYNPTSLTVIV